MINYEENFGTYMIILVFILFVLVMYSTVDAANKCYQKRGQIINGKCYERLKEIK